MASVPVYRDLGPVIGSWPEGTSAQQVLSDIRKRIGLNDNVGVLICNNAIVSSDTKLEPSGHYWFRQLLGTSAYDICHASLPPINDIVTTTKTTGGVLDLDTITVDTDWHWKQLQLQEAQPQETTYLLETSSKTYTPAKREFALTAALRDLGLGPLNSMLADTIPYKAEWTVVEDSNKISRSGSGHSRRTSGSGSRLNSEPGSRRNSGQGSRRNSGPGRQHNSSTTSREGAAAGAAAAAADALLAAAFAGTGPPAPPRYHVHMDPFSPGKGIAHIKHTMRDQAQGLATFIGVPKKSLRADLRLWADALGWHQAQQLLQAPGVVSSAGGSSSGGSGSGNGSGSVPMSHAPTVGSHQSAATAALPAVAAATATTSSAAAVAAAAAAPQDGVDEEDSYIVLVNGEVKPASVVCRAFGMEVEEFKQRIADCDIDQQPGIFDLAAQCNARNHIAREIVSQAVGYSFFSGTRFFALTCYTLHWVGDLVKVVEVEREDGRPKLKATVKLSGPIFGKAAGAGCATARGAYLRLSDLALNQKYPLRQIAKPDATLPADMAAGAVPQGASEDDDTGRRGRGDQQRHQQQQQHQHQPHIQGGPPQQQQQQQQPQQRHCQPSSGQSSAPLDQHMKQQPRWLTAAHVQLHRLISDGDTAQVFDATFEGQKCIVKTFSLHWEPPGSHMHEPYMYDQLVELQQAGVLPRLLGHGEYYGLRYFMALAPAPGGPLSKLPCPYSPSVQQAVKAAVAQLHECDVVHDDLHADNIFVHLTAGAAQVTIIDLGRARFVSSAEEKQREMNELVKLLQ